ncbi:MAG: phosphate/phosphite/phosphonate ABC transporter substrate-binding protein [Rhodocyclaceae bacterium]|nr:phosphate/phosphite/phosphonate ABC transporter substrate-binding protein [Rhodocyclaceae bacterium]
MAIVDRLRRIFLIIGLMASAPLCGAEEPKPYSVYVTPQLPPEVMHQAWFPLLETLSRETGLKFNLVIPPSIPAFETLLLKGMPDFAFMNPYLQLPAKKSQGYVPLVRTGQSMLVGQLLVRDDSPAKTLKDLDGATIAFPAPNSFAASLYLRAMLTREKIRFTPIYVGSHSNAYRHALFGEALACGGVNFSLAREPADVRGKLRSIYSTPPLMPHPFSAHSRVPAQVRERVTAALLRLAARPENRALFHSTQMPEPVRADYVRDYQPMEALGLDKLLVFGGD